jgi:N-acetylglutamate synthase-like GNAT family acetyltransferase
MMMTMSPESMLLGCHLEIVPYRDDHKEAIGRMISGVQQEFGIAITLADQPDLLDITGSYRQGRGNFWVGLDAGQVVGSVALIDAGNGIGVLRKMFVQPDYRGAMIGLGQRLLDTLLAWAAAHGFREIYLGTTDKFEAARRFYAKNGFAPIADGQLPPSIQRIRMKVDTLHYRKELHS